MCRKVLISLLIVMLVLSGCGQGDRPLAETVDPGFTETGDTAQGDEETGEESVEMEGEVGTGNMAREDEHNEPSEELPESSEIPVNTTAETLLYYSEDDILLEGAKYRCAADGENIYLAYGETDLYVMPIGADRHSQAHIDNPEGMHVCQIALDTYGRIHLLMAGSDYDEWFIWRLDESFQMDKVIDISSYFETQRPPKFFLIDKGGTYYMQWPVSQDGIIVDSEGALKHRSTRESLEIREIYEAAVGKDGRIYLIYSEQGDKLEIGELDLENCTIKKDSPLWFSGSETFTRVFAGTDTNLLLYSPYSGIWAYDQEMEVMENRVPVSDMGSGSGMDLCPLMFLPDGRLLLVERGTNDICLKYIPVGK